MKFNNKGFTLVEVLAVLVIIGILGGIAIPNVLKSINSSKDASYDILIKNIITGSIQLFEEVEYGDSKIYQYNEDGTISSSRVSITENEITTNLQTLVSNGFLIGVNDESKSHKIILNPKTNENIGSCEITITKKIDNNNNNNNKVTYELKDNSEEEKCPKYNEVGE